MKWHAAALNYYEYPVMCQNSADPLRGPPVVVVQDSTQPFSSSDIATRVGRATSILDQLVLEPLMIALDVVVLGVCLHGRPKVTLAEWNDLGQAFGLDRENESLRIRIQVGTCSSAEISLFPNSGKQAA